MKDFLIEKRPRLCLLIIGVFFIFNILTIFIPIVGNTVILYPANLSQPLTWYRFITYPLFVGGLTNWVYASLVIVLTGYLIENRGNRIVVFSILFLSTIVGGVVYALLSKYKGEDVPFASPTIIAWGFWGAGIVAGIKNRHVLSKVEKWIFGIIILCILNLTIGNFETCMSQLLVIVVCGSYCFIRGEFPSKSMNPYL